MYPNFNRSLEHARGRFIKFLCADDRIEPRYLESALALCERYPSVGIVSALSMVIDERGRMIARRAPHRRRGPEFIPGTSIIRRAPWHHNELGTPSHVLLRREVFDKVGAFDVSYRTVNDWEMWLRACTRFDAAFIRDYLVVIRVHDAQSSNAPDASLLVASEVFHLADKFYASRRWLRRLLLVRNAESLLWSAAGRLIRGERRSAGASLKMVIRNVPLVTLVAYVVLHAPVWVAHAWRRRRALHTGRIWEQ
jgi:glycosyltransferase involved in cell wall biosynthesis